MVRADPRRLEEQIVENISRYFNNEAYNKVTGISNVDHCKALFADVAMGKSNNAIHAMTGELLSGGTIR